MGTTKKRMLGVFAKWPRAGVAKTRLAPDHPGWTASVARAFLFDALDRLAIVGTQRSVVFDPPDAQSDFAELVRGRYVLTPQGPGDLGQRLANFFHSWVAAGAEAVVVVGTDSPTLPVEFVERAFAELDRADVVIGPATDGGYYLIGCGAQVPPMFANLDWSKSGVLAATIAALHDPRWRLSVLPPWYDVDTADDWAMLGGHIAALRRAGLDPGVPNTEAMLEIPRPR